MDDLISRQAAIKVVQNRHMMLSKEKVLLINDLEKLPSAESERKNGNWVWKDKKEFCPCDCWFPPTGYEDTWNEKEGSWIEKQLYCSECNFENWRHYKSNFCPNCGAKMEVTTPPECEGDCGWCKPTVIEKCKGVTT